MKNTITNENICTGNDGDPKDSPDSSNISDFIFNKKAPPFNVQDNYTLNSEVIADNKLFIISESAVFHSRLLSADFQLNESL